MDISSKAVSVIVGLLLFLPSAAAASEARLRTAQPPAWTGSLDVAASDVAVAYRLAPHVTLQVRDAAFEIVRVRMSVAETPLGDVAYQPEYANESFEEASASLDFAPRALGVLYAHYAGGAPVALAMRGLDARAFAPSARPDDYAYKMNSSLPFFFRDAPPLDAWEIGPEGARVTAQAPGVLFATEGAMRIRTAQGERVEELGAHASRAAAGVPARTDEYAFLRVKAREIVSQADAARAWVHPDRVAFDGAARFADATGVVTSGARDYPLAQGGVTLTGRGALDWRDPDATGARELRVAGDFSGIRLADARGLVLSAGPGVAAVAAGAALLLALAALYTRIRPTRVLESAERTALYERVVGSPGLHLRELQRHLDWGWGRLHYHLAVLERGGLVVVRTQGKHKFVYARAAVASARVELKPRGAAADVYAALEASPLTQGDLQRSLGYSRQLIAHHLRTLASDGLVTSSPGRPRVYRVVSHRDALPPPVPAESA